MNAKYVFQLQACLWLAVSVVLIAPRVGVAQVVNQAPVFHTDFGALPLGTATYNTGGGPLANVLPPEWGTNLWNPGSKAESGIGEEGTTRLKGLYLLNTEGTPAIQVFTLKPLELTPGAHYLASVVYMSEGDALGQFSVSGEAEKEPVAKETLEHQGIWKERIVPFTAPASGKVTFYFSTGAVGKKFYVRDFTLKKGPVAWKPSPESLPAPGANVDETLVKTTLFVDANSAAAKDTNVGSKASPFRSFGAALERAKTLLAKGTPTRISLAEGVYREDGLQLDGEKVGGKAVDTTLVIEGAAKQKVIFSGADVAGWEPKTWTLVDAKKKIYKHAWTYNWGPSDAMYYKPDNTLAQRREMLFLNGRTLKQKLVENIVYKPGGWAPRVDDAGMRAAGNWSNEGYLGPTVLQPGEFGVAELGPGETIQNYGYEKHPDPNTIFLRLPADVVSLDGAKIEVPMRSQWLRLFSKNNLVLRNITVQEFNPYDASSVFEVEWFWSGRDNHDWTLDNVSISDNGGVAANISWVRALTFRNCRFNRNGSTGASFIARDLLCEDTIFSNNGWRNTGHGLWFALQNAMFRRCAANENNDFGFRNDSADHYLTFEKCEFNRNKRSGGIFFEISQGPITLKNCDILDNAECGFRAISAQNVTLDGCRLINNEGAQIFIEADKRNTHLMFSMLGTNVPLDFPYMKNWTVKNSTLVAKGKDGSIYSKVWWGGDPSAYVAWFGHEFHGGNNRYWNPDNPKSFNIAAAWERKDWEWADLAGWQKATGADAGSVWKAPS